jgi:gliding motility-associated-like protein
MKFINKILFLLVFVLITLTGNAQTLPAVCAGDNSSYAVDGLPNSVFIWEIDNENVEVINYGDTAEINWDVSPGVYKISVREITEQGCEGAPVYAFVNVASSYIDIGDEIDLCEGEAHTFNPGTYDMYTWQDGSTGSNYTATTSEMVWVEVKNNSGCKGWDTAYVVVHENPTVYLGNDTSLCGGSYVELDAGSFDNYEWSTGDNSRWLTAYAGEERISVKVTDHNGCTSEDSINILACTNADLLGKIANAFTPNGDGQHDTWEINNIHMFPNIKIEVFDRWGRLVYTSENGYNNDWDGTSMEGKELPMDTYYYVINFNVEGYDTVVGNVALIR